MQLCTKFSAALAVAALVAMPDRAEGQALQQPDGWHTRAERFVAMPPGFHITTNPSVLFYHPDARAAGEFAVESEGFLFQGDSPNAYGVFIGGRNLDGDDAAWTSFEIAHDGTWVVRERRADETGAAVVTAVAGPAAGPVAVPGEEVTAKNVLSISADDEAVVFRLNGELIASLPRTDLAVDGIVGFRVGADLNLHLTTLSITSDGSTTAWAPAAEAGEGGR